MEDAADAVVPLRPGFDVQVRGFNRNQVIEHIELLEDQLKLVTFDRNEAVAVSSDLRRLCDDTRHDLDEAEQRLKRIESSDTGLPAASQRVQNMLAIAEEEVQTLRDQTMRQAETIRGTAETEAKQLLADAERATEDLRKECDQLAAGIEEHRDQMRREHAKNLRELREREHRLRQAVRGEYKKTMAVAEQEADALLAQAQQECGKREAETEQHRMDTLSDLHAKRVKFEELRQAVLTALSKTRESIETSVTTLRAEEVTPAIDAEPPAAAGNDGLRLPEQRQDTRTFTIPLDRPAANGSAPDTETHDNAQWN